MLRDFQILVMCGVVWFSATGCTTTVSSNPSDLIDQSQAIQPIQEFNPPYDPTGGETRIVVASSSATGSRNEYEEIARRIFTEVAAKSRNLKLLSRDLLPEARAEMQLATGGGANPKTVPKSPGIDVAQYIVRLTVSQVERTIKDNGSRGEWSLVVGATQEQENREGAVEVLMEVVEVATLEVQFTHRSYGTLFEKRKSSAMGFMGIGGSQSSVQRVPDAQAIRSACQDSVSAMLDFLETAKKK